MKDFYEFYLSEHKNIINRRLHFIGSLFSISLLIILIFIKKYNLIYIPFLTGYVFAWIGHFFFEKNKPATFKAPIKSFLCDWIMTFDIIRGKVKIL